MNGLPHYVGQGAYIPVSQSVYQLWPFHPHDQLTYVQPSLLVTGGGTFGQQQLYQHNTQSVWPVVTSNGTFWQEQPQVRYVHRSPSLLSTGGGGMIAQPPLLDPHGAGNQCEANYRLGSHHYNKGNKAGNKSSDVDQARYRWMDDGFKPGVKSEKYKQVNKDKLHVSKTGHQLLTSEHGLCAGSTSAVKVVTESTGLNKSMTVHSKKPEVENLSVQSVATLPLPVSDVVSSSVEMKAAAVVHDLSAKVLFWMLLCCLAKDAYATVLQIYICCCALLNKLSNLFARMQNDLIPNIRLSLEQFCKHLMQTLRTLPESIPIGSFKSAVQLKMCPSVFFVLLMMLLFGHFACCDADNHNHRSVDVDHIVRVIPLGIMWIEYVNASEFSNFSCLSALSSGNIVCKTSEEDPQGLFQRTRDGFVIPNATQEHARYICLTNLLSSTPGDCYFFIMLLKGKCFDASFGIYCTFRYFCEQLAVGVYFVSQAGKPFRCMQHNLSSNSNGIQERLVNCTLTSETLGTVYRGKFDFNATSISAAIASVDASSVINTRTVIDHITHTAHSLWGWLGPVVIVGIVLATAIILVSVCWYRHKKMRHHTQRMAVRFVPPELLEVRASTRTSSSAPLLTVGAVREQPGIKAAAQLVVPPEQTATDCESLEANGSADVCMPLPLLPRVNGAKLEHSESEVIPPILQAVEIPLSPVATVSDVIHEQTKSKVSPLVEPNAESLSPVVNANYVAPGSIGNSSDASPHNGAALCHLKEDIFEAEMAQEEEYVDLYNQGAAGQEEMHGSGKADDTDLTNFEVEQLTGDI